MTKKVIKVSDYLFDETGKKINDFGDLSYRKIYSEAGSVVGKVNSFEPENDSWNIGLDTKKIIKTEELNRYYIHI